MTFSWPSSLGCCCCCCCYSSFNVSVCLPSCLNDCFIRRNIAFPFRGLIWRTRRMRHVSLARIRSCDFGSSDSSQSSGRRRDSRRSGAGLRSQEPEYFRINAEKFRTVLPGRYVSYYVRLVTETDWGSPQSPSSQPIASRLCNRPLPPSVQICE